MNIVENKSATPTQKSSPERIMQLSWGYAAPLIIEAAVHFKLFDILDKQEATVDELSAEAGASQRGVEALLNALVGIQLLNKNDNRFSLTPESAAYLVSHKPGYRGALFKHHTDQLLPQWMGLKEIVRSGHPIAKTNHSTDGAKHFAAFVESLFAGSFPAAKRLGEHLKIAESTDRINVLDIGAGSGVWGIALAQLSSQVRITAVDWPEVLAIARKVADAQGVGDRLSTIPGDFATVDFGSGYHIATLGHILHSEGPERIVALLKKAHASLVVGGTIAIQEFVPNDDRSGPPLPLLFAVNMLVNTEHGSTYTFSEISAWLKASGFQNPRLLDVPGPSPLILATK